jgi:hypothetical protein
MARAITRQLRVSTCGSDDLTRCCVYKTSGAAGECRILRPARCDATKQRAAGVLDVGPGSCAADTCAN